MRGFGGKAAGITDAGSGMGRSLAIKLARRGCDLALSHIDESKLAQTLTKCAAYGVRAIAGLLDVPDHASVFSWAKQVSEKHGRVNLIFNNAGEPHSAPVETAGFEDFEWIMGINFWGVVHGTQALKPNFRASGGMVT
jgi:NAD(P)-dependent dehydrogenase (short-subunit alcohol dehydrogenase family)